MDQDANYLYEIANEELVRHPPLWCLHLNVLSQQCISLALRLWRARGWGWRVGGIGRQVECMGEFFLEGQTLPFFLPFILSLELAWLPMSLILPGTWFSLLTLNSSRVLSHIASVSSSTFLFMLCKFSSNSSIHCFTGLFFNICEFIWQADIAIMNKIDY